MIAEPSFSSRKETWPGEPHLPAPAAPGGREQSPSDTAGPHRKPEGMDGPRPGLGSVCVAPGAVGSSLHRQKPQMATGHAPWVPRAQASGSGSGQEVGPGWGQRGTRPTAHQGLVSILKRGKEGLLRKGDKPPAPFPAESLGAQPLGFLE